MTKHPICIDVNSKISDIIDIMSEKELRRTPVTSGKKLVGLVTKGMISKKGASRATSLSIYELNYLLSKISVDTIMIHDVATIHKDRFLEDTVLPMYEHDVDCLPAVNGANEVAGTLTSNDVLSAFLGILGYRINGSHVRIEVKGELGTIGKTSEIFVCNNCNVAHPEAYSQYNGFADMIVHTDTFQTDILASDLETSGYEVLSIIKSPN